MLVAQATDLRTVRGVAHVGDAPVPEDAGFASLIDGGRLVVSVEQGTAPPWQGVVPLEGESLARCLEKYFLVSEQLPTALVLAADARHAAGLLLQKLPAPAGEGEAAAAGTQDLWDEVITLMSTLRPAELLALDPGQLLSSLFGAHDLRLFEGEAVRFACRCDRQRVAVMLRGLGQAEVRSILAEQGEVTVTCEFCRKPYRFDAVDAAGLFVAGSTPDNQRIN
jgi:molecular chaperone Hsp33